jgi:sugar phosphate isomerase/epimerase
VVELGISSFAGVREPIQDVEQELAGFGIGVEIMCEPPHAWPPPVPWSAARVLTLHAPILGINIASTNPGIREESVAQMIATITEAARLNARGVVIHPGMPPYRELFPRDLGLPYAIESLRECAEAAAAVGVEAYVENMPAVSLAEGMRPIGFGYAVAYEELRHIYEAVNHPALRICLDLGLAYLAGRHVLDALLKDPDVVHVHVNDNLGQRDDHLAWGDGEVAKVVDLAANLPPSVRTLVLEHSSLETARRSFARVSADLTRRRQTS